MDFLFPEILTSRMVEWKYIVDELSDPDTAPYDMVIGADLLAELAMDLRFRN